jgi:hypothetical protein
VGEEALSWYGIARIARKEEWPSWTPTAEIKRRLGNIPDFVEGGPHNPMGARALYLYQGGKDTLFRIHGYKVVFRELQPFYSEIGRPSVDPSISDRYWKSTVLEKGGVKITLRRRMAAELQA